jgi:predicted transcriptional regulator
MGIETGMTTQTITAHIPKDLVSKVDALAAALDRPRGWVVKEALAEWVAMEEERRRLTLEAMADVDAGRVIDHEAMLAWGASLTSASPLPLPRA